MVFSSLFFLCFFLPSSIFINYLFSKWIKVQNFFLMIFSLAFYYWGEKDHIFVMIACIAINYISGILIEQSNKILHKKIYLTFSIVSSLGLLFYFKYFNFFVNNLNEYFGFKLEFAKIFLPIGISFYTFHALSYVIDVYWNKIKAEKNFITFVCYVSLFPQLVAGPIVRYRDIGQSFYSRFITGVGFKNGITRFCFGLGKKVLIADSLALIADKVFALPLVDLTFSTSWLGAIAYMLQIYFDFSGYSDMAIGIGLMFGFKYKENFIFPYTAISIQDFWRRWHISLSSWFRDYVYIPLGGNKKSEGHTYFNLIFVFLLCGFWHGANYTFIAWGLFHGFFLILERTKIGLYIKKLPVFLRHLYVLVTVLFGWVLFRAEHLSEAIIFYKAMLSPINFECIKIYEDINFYTILVYLLGIIISLGFSCYVKNYLIFTKSKSMISNYKTISLVFSLIILLLCLLPISNNSYSPFLYFRF